MKLFKVLNVLPCFYAPQSLAMHATEFLALLLNASCGNATSESKLLLESSFYVHGLVHSAFLNETTIIF